MLELIQTQSGYIVIVDGKATMITRRTDLVLYLVQQNLLDGVETIEIKEAA